MRIPVLDQLDTLALFLAGIAKTLGYMSGSGLCWIIAQALPEEQGIIKAASALTGWGLAIACIYTLVRAVRILFGKLEEKDKIIAELHETAVSKADSQRKEMLEELKAINHNSRRSTDH